MNLAATVILFHPSSDSLTNIESYLNEVDILYVIDNSSIKDEKLLNDIGEHSPKCKLLINPENYGIAKALNQAVEWALNDGYEWLLTMDQDSTFPDNTYFQAFQEYPKKDKVALFSPTVHADGHKVNHTKEISYQALRDIVITSGSIINLAKCNEAGRFNEKLFIDAVDTDFCLNFLQFKQPIIRINGTILNHKMGDLRTIQLPFGLNLKVKEHSPVRHYYIARNHTYILFKYFTSSPRLTLLNSYRLCRKFVVAIATHKEKAKVFKYSVKGIYHFLTGKYGKYE